MLCIKTQRSGDYRKNTNMNHPYLNLQEDRERSSSSSGGSAETYFHPINQTPPVWSNTERPLPPPSPIQTTNSFDRYSNSPIPLRNPFEQRGGDSLPQPSDNFTWEGYHDQFKVDRAGTEREDPKQCAAASPPRPPSFAAGFHANNPNAFHQIHHHSYDDYTANPHNPYVSHHHMVYRFEPHYLPSTWHAMYKPTEMDRKPSALSYSPNRPPISPVKTSNSPPTNVPPVASRNPDAYAGSNHTPSTRVAAASNSPPSPPARRPQNRRSRKGKGGRRHPVAPQRRSNHVHESPTAKELHEASTNRAQKAVRSWYERFNELVDYANTYGDTAVPQQFEENHALGIWVNKQRMEMKAFVEQTRTSMTRRRTDLLEKVGFEWAKPKGQAAWDQKFQELLDYKEVHGDCHVPTKHKANRPLGRWVSTQRNMKKNYDQGQKPKSLDHDEIHRRIQMLEEIGFAWSMVESPASNDSS